MRRPVASIAVLVAVLAGCGGKHPAKPSASERTIPAAPRPATGALPWPAPADALHRAALAGVPVGRYEYGIPGHPGKHIHAHLDIFVNGKPARVPSALGIAIDVPGVQSSRLPDGTYAYGGIKLCAGPCIAALHTHDDSGVIHIESQKPRPYTLGELFTEWKVRLDRNCVGGYCRPRDSIRVFVDGKPFTVNPATLTLRNMQEIAIVIGSPPQEIPSKFPQ